MNSTTATTYSPRSGNALNIGLWAAQIVLLLLFCMAGYMKFFMPIPQVSKLMPWTGQLPAHFVRTMGVIDLLGGIGVVLPAVTRILPWLTVLAALGCTVLQICAICFHVSRGEFYVLPLNAVMLPLSAFVLWGRWKKVPILPR